MSKLFISETRMLQFMEYCVENKIAGVSSIKDWCERVGFEYTNMDKVKKGTRGFSKQQMYAAAIELGMSMDYAFGFTDDMFRSKKKISPMQLLKAAVRAVEMENQNRKVVTKTVTKSTRRG